MWVEAKRSNSYASHPDSRNPPPNFPTYNFPEVNPHGTFFLFSVLSRRGPYTSPDVLSFPWDSRPLS